LFFYLSKILWFAASPPNVAISLSVLGTALLFTRWRRLGRTVALVGAVSLVLLGISALPRIALLPLENRFPIIANDEGRIDGLIVLGGGINISRGQVSLKDAAASRVTAAVELARKHPEAKLVFSGGTASLLDPSAEPEAEAAGALFRLFNIPAERVVLEDRSRNTQENALFTRNLVTPKPGERWLLITSASHMPRAMGCFRAVGLNLEAYPVDFRTEGKATDYWRPFDSLSEGLSVASLAIKEWIGLVAYRLSGYTTELLPAPSMVSVAPRRLRPPAPAPA
jgi:uncharacterized SAM-binding protein YcdF (DUF218 family)